MLVVLDLDATLIHSTLNLYQNLDCNSHIIEWNSYFAGFITGKIRVIERPHLAYFLSYLFANYQVAVWTAGTKDYADIIVDCLFEEKQASQLSFVWDRSHCEKNEDGTYIKPLQKVRQLLPQFEKEHIYLVDDCTANESVNKEFYLPIVPFDPFLTQQYQPWSISNPSVYYTTAESMSQATGDSALLDMIDVLEQRRLSHLVYRYPGLLLCASTQRLLGYPVF